MQADWGRPECKQTSENVNKVIITSFPNCLDVPFFAHKNYFILYYNNVCFDEDYMDWFGRFCMFLILTKSDWIEGAEHLVLYIYEKTHGSDHQNEQVVQID